MGTSDKKTEKNHHKTDEKEMPFLDHLEELRSRIFKALISIVIFAIISWIFIDEIFAVLVAPYQQAVSIALKGQSDKIPESLNHLVFLNPTGGFLVYIKLAATVGFILSLPVVFYQIWQFVAPGLLANERRFAPILILSTIFCFLSGAAFCYFVVLKFGLGFLLSFQSPTLVPMISIEDYFGFVTALILIFGLVFQMPILAFFLTRLGLLTPDFLRKKRRYGIVAIFIAAAVITPSVDAFTQILLAAPLLVLYEISIWVSKFAMPVAVENAVTQVPAN